MNILNRSAFAALCLLLCCTAASGWGRQGHATVARIAENHLTRTTAKKVSAIMHGEPISGYASYADENKKHLLVDMGFDPTGDDPRINTLPHTFEASAADFEPFRGINDNGRYVKNCIHFIEQYAADLTNWKELDDSTAFTELVLLVHFVGDMHCPEHIRYNPDDMTIGYYNVTFLGDEIRYHTLWDSVIISQRYPWSFGDLAYILDGASDAEIEEITAGKPYDWGRDIARKCRPVHDVQPGAKLNSKWYNEQLPLVRMQLRDAGYRLAKELNMIFDPAFARKHKKDAISR